MTMDAFKGLPFTEPKVVPRAHLDAPLLDQGPEGLAEFGRRMCAATVALAREAQRRDEGPRCTARIFCRRHPVTREDGDVVVQMQITGDHDNYAVKRSFCELVRMTATFAEARAVVVMMEAWFVAGKEGERREDLPRDLGLDPRREEIFLLSVETADGYVAYRAPITRFGQRGLAIGDWVGREFAENRVGLFTELMKPFDLEGLRQSAAAHRAVDDALAKAKSPRK